jgi:hypothetical protein
MLREYDVPLDLDLDLERLYDLALDLDLDGDLPRGP